MTLLSDHYEAMRRPKSRLRIIRMAISIDPVAWIGSALAVLAILAAIATATPQTVIVEEIFSPDMFWTRDGEMVVLEGVSYAADELEGDEDRQVCEILADEFEGEEATLEILRELRSPDHAYLISRVQVGKIDMNDRAEEIIAEVIGEREWEYEECE